MRSSVCIFVIVARCATASVTAGGELSFNVQPVDTVAYVGQPAILHCLVNNKLHPTHVYWMKDGSTIQLDSRRSFNVSVVNSSFRVRRMSKDFCFAVELFAIHTLISKTEDGRSAPRQKLSLIHI